MLCCCAAVGYLCLCLYLCLHFVKIRELDLVPAQTCKNADVVYLCLCLCLRFEKKMRNWMWWQNRQVRMLLLLRAQQEKPIGLCSQI